MSARRRPGAGVLGLGAAIGTASLAGFALLFIIGRLLTPAEFGLFVAFWGVLFGIGSSLSTIEQETARRAAQTGDEPGPPMSAVTAASAVIVTLVAVLTLLPPVADRLYGDPHSLIGLVVAASAMGFAIQFAVRGVLMGSNWIRSYAGIVVLEALARLAFVLLFAVALDFTLPVAALAVATGSFAWVFWIRRAPGVLPRRAPSLRESAQATRRAGSLMLGAALTASMITGYPTLVTVLAGTPDAAAGAVFAALTISRVPLLLVSPVQAMAVPAVVRWNSADHGAGPSILRRMLLLGTLSAAGLSVLGGAAGWLLGPWAVRLAYGSDYVVTAWAVAILVASACLLAWVLLLSAALMALAAYRRMITMWFVAVTATIVWLVISPLDLVAATAVGALVGPLAAASYGIPALWGLTRRRAEEPSAVAS